MNSPDEVEQTHRLMLNFAGLGCVKHKRLRRDLTRTAWFGIVSQHTLDLLFTTGYIGHVDPFVRVWQLASNELVEPHHEL